MKSLLLLTLFLVQLLQAQDYPKLFEQLGTPLYKADKAFINISKLDANIKKKAKHYHLKVQKLLILANKIESTKEDNKKDKKKYINDLRGLQKDYDAIIRSINAYLIKSIDANNYQEFTRIMNLGHVLFLQNQIIKKRAMAYYVEHRTRGKIAVLETSYQTLKTDPILYQYVKGHLPKTHPVTQTYSDGAVAHKVLLSKDEKTAFIAYGNHCFQSIDIELFEDASTVGNFDFHSRECNIINMHFSRSKQHVFISDLENGFTIVDVSQPKSLLQKAEYTRIHALASVSSQDDNTSFIIRKNRGLSILDTKDKDNIKVLANYTRGGVLNHLAFDDNRSMLYVVHSTGLSILDLSTLGNPREIYHLPIKDGANNIILSPSKKIAYVASGDNGVHVFDISNPTKISRLSTCLTPSYAYELMLSKNGEKLFVSALDEGVYYINTKNPYDLKHVSTYKLDKPKASALSSTLNTKENTLFIAYGKLGLAKVPVKD